MNKKFFKDDNGFSLLELIVAVLILGIISASAIAGFNTIFNARSEAAANVAASVLKQTRSKTMALTENSDAKTYARFYLQGSNYYVDLVREETIVVNEITGETATNTNVLVSKKLGNDGLTLTFRSHNTPAILGEVTATNDVKVTFKRNTGGIKEIVAGSSDDSVLDELFITGSGGDKKVIIVRATGRCYNAD